MRRKYKLPQVGDVYGEWTVIAVPTYARGRYLCQCSCGTQSEVWYSNLVTGQSTRCKAGGHSKYFVNTKYSAVCPDIEIRNRLQHRINNAIKRCTQSQHKQYHRYGGRGITVYEPWIKDKRLFMAYLLTLDGHDDEMLTIDRVNNNKGYEPGNLQFATPSEQAYNRESR